MMKSRRVIPGRGVNQRAQGARITSTSTPSSGVAPSEYLTLGMARFHTHICGNPKKDKKQIHCPLQKLERSQTFLSPQVLCDLSMTNQMTLSDSEGLKQKKGSMKHFYGPCSGVESPQWFGDKGSEDQSSATKGNLEEIPATDVQPATGDIPLSRFCLAWLLPQPVSGLPVVSVRYAHNSNTLTFHLSRPVFVLLSVTNRVAVIKHQLLLISLAP